MRVERILKYVFNLDVTDLELFNVGEKSKNYTFISNDKKYILKVRPYTRDNKEYKLQTKASKFGLAANTFGYAVIDNQDDKRIIREEYIISEFIEGENFSKYVEDLNYEEIVNISSKVLDNIKKLHEINICHGDLIFGNIMIDKNENVYFIDFEYAEKIIDPIDEEYDILDFLHFMYYNHKKVAIKLGYDHRRYERIFHKYFQLHPSNNN